MDFGEWSGKAVEAARSAIPAEVREWLTEPGWIAVWVSVFTLFVVIIQIRIMRRQTRLMTRQDSTTKHQTGLMAKQLEIAERQAGIIEKQLALCPAPRIRLDTSKESARLTRVRVTVDNREGTKGLKDFEWSVWFPKSVIDGGAMVIEGRLIGMVSMTTIDDIDYIQFSSIHANPIFPTLESFVGEAKTVSEELKPFRKVYWRVVCNDGKFPESERGMIELRPAE